MHKIAFTLFLALQIGFAADETASPRYSMARR